jgi:hypothetical protein
MLFEILHDLEKQYLFQLFIDSNMAKPNSDLLDVDTKHQQLSQGPDLQCMQDPVLGTVIV